MSKNFHDVDFTARGPSNILNVGSEHPKGGPEALCVWDSHAGFHHSIREADRPNVEMRADTMAPR